MDLTKQETLRQPTTGDRETFRTINKSKFDPNNHGSRSLCWQNYNFLLMTSADYRGKRKTREYYVTKKSMRKRTVRESTSFVLTKYMKTSKSTIKQKEI